MQVLSYSTRSIESQRKGILSRMGRKRNQHPASLPSASAMTRAAGVETAGDGLTGLKLAVHPDQSTDEYARENCLSIDSIYDFVSSRLTTVITLGECSFSTEIDGLSDGSYLKHSSTLSHFPASTEERFEAVKGSYDLIEEVTHMSDAPEQIADLLCPHIHPYVAQWTLDRPILQTDIEYDCRDLARSISTRKNGMIGPGDLPLETLNEANDESLSFPDTAYHRRDDLTALVRNENFDITRATFDFLAWQHQADITDCTALGMTRDYLSLEMIIRGPLTPPLLPSEHVQGPFIPTTECCQVPLASDPSTLLDEDIQTAEASMLKEYEAVDGCDEIAPEGSPSSGKMPPLTPPQNCRASRSSAHIEEPLIPMSSSPATRISDMLPMMFRGMQIDQNSEISTAQRSADPDGAFSDDLLTTLEAQSTNLAKVTEQERLQVSDVRVSVPVLDFTVTDPEWEKIGLDVSSQWNLIQGICATMNFPPWSGSLRERELCWIPANLSPIPLQEDLGVNETLTMSVGSTDSSWLSTSADFVWKHPGVAILRDREDDYLEQIEQIPEQNSNDDLDSLVRKRRVELDSMSQHSAPGSKGIGRNLLARDDGSAAETLLSNYMEFRAAKRQKHSKSSFFPVKHTLQDALEITVATKPTATVTRNDIIPKTPPPESHLEKRPLSPCPLPLIPAESIKIIRSVALSRGIFSRFAKLCPDADIIERDFGRWNSVAWERGSVSRSPVVSSLAAEADIIVSPSTGIVITTILRAIQKPPPGHKGASEIRERLLSVALRYERLIVLVSEGNKIDETARDLTSSECTAYADFTGFVAGLDTNGQAYYIRGGDDTLARWLLHFVVHYSQEAALIQAQLIQDESHWELFLRRAGMNAYAAQAILALLKRPEGSPDEHVSLFGLPHFIRMSATERVRRFRDLLGGDRVLARVNNAIDTFWNTTASE